jgi:predicted RecA/RadA family phage recombinase
MKNHVKTGGMLTAIAPVNGVVSGAFVIVGAAFGIAATSALEGEEYELKLGEIWELPKTSAQAWTLGAAIYWDAANSVATTTSSGNTKIGVAAAVAANPSATGIVRLNSNF